MSRRYDSLMRQLASDYEHFDEIPPSALYEPAAAWWEQYDANSAHEPLTEGRDIHFTRIFRQMGPRVMHELAALRSDEHNNFMDAAADLGIAVAQAVIEYAMKDLYDAFERCPFEEAAMRADDARDRARDALAERAA